MFKLGSVVFILGRVQLSLENPKTGMNRVAVGVRRFGVFERHGST